ncbi:uncharacterized protein LOC135079223 isoform X1 [Ostrinia nubilalis]|uniref:uncharacterized protein LOC135079223 isoform X1 n=1 Tax=Ostrinia nubilalis TaxID=29057 RepID=UPI0030825BAD
MAEDEEAAPETLEEAGVLEADVGARFDQQLAGIDPKLKIDMDPFAHRDLRPEMMFIREELRQAKWQTLAIHRRRAKARKARRILPVKGKSHPTTQQTRLRSFQGGKRADGSPNGK